MRHPRHDSISARATSLVALAGLIAVAWRCVSATHVRDRTGRAAVLPQPLQVWEDEGGQNQMPESPPVRPAEAKEPGPPGLH